MWEKSPQVGTGSRASDGRTGPRYSARRPALSSAAAAARAAAGAAPQISPDGSWYWDGRVWRTVARVDARWGWDGCRWIPLRAPRRVRASHLIGLLILDLLGFAPGAFLASVVAATALLALDARGLVTLSGLI